MQTAPLCELTAEGRRFRPCRENRSRPAAIRHREPGDCLRIDRDQEQCTTLPLRCDIQLGSDAK